MNKVHIEPLENISTVIAHQLIRLNHGETGQMLPVLNHFLNGGGQYYGRMHKDPVIYYIINDNTVLAWAIVFKKANWMYRKGKGYYSNKSFMQAVHLYTDPNERGNGYGSALAKAVRETVDGDCYGSKDDSSIFTRFNLIGKIKS